MAQCKSSSSCERPATWRVEVSHGRPYIRQCRQWQAPDYCKVHIERELVRLMRQLEAAKDVLHDTP